MCVGLDEGMRLPSRGVLGPQWSRGPGFVPVDGACVSLSFSVIAPFTGAWFSPTFVRVPR